MCCWYSSRTVVLANTFGIYHKWEVKLRKEQRTWKCRSLITKVEKEEKDWEIWWERQSEWENDEDALPLCVCACETVLDRDRESLCERERVRAISMRATSMRATSMRATSMREWESERVREWESKRERERGEKNFQKWPIYFRSPFLNFDEVVMLKKRMKNLLRWQKNCVGRIFFHQKNEAVNFYFYFARNFCFWNFNRGHLEWPVLLESRGRDLLEADGRNRRRGRAA